MPAGLISASAIGPRQRCGVSGPSTGMPWPASGQAASAGVASAAADVPSRVRRLIMKASPIFWESLGQIDLAQNLFFCVLKLRNPTFFQIARDGIVIARISRGICLISQRYINHHALAGACEQNSVGIGQIE